MYKDKRAKDWEEEAGWVIKQSWDKKPLEGYLNAYISIFYKFEPDIDAPLKIVLDIFQKKGIKVIDNDKQIVYMTVQKIKDKVFPRVEVQIEEV